MTNVTDVTNVTDDKLYLCAYGDEEARSNPECQKLLQEETIKCHSSFFHWMKWTRIVETPTIDNPGGVIPFQLWEHIKITASHLLKDRLLSILKARQIGISYLIANYAVWFSSTHDGATILLFSKAEDEAFELLAKCREIYEQLPPFLKLPLDPDSRGTMGFPKMHSIIKALPSTESAGVSYNASIIVYDEHDVHEYATKSYFHAKPAIDSGGGQLISIFTVNPWDDDTLAKSIFKGAMEEANDFTWLFFPYWARPGHDKEWYEYVKRNTRAEELRGLTRELYMQKNYPASIEEALRPTSATSVFDHKILNEMQESTRQPLSVSIEGVDPKICHIYQDYHIGEAYIAASDTSHGVGQDYSVTVILNIRTGAVVADIFNNRISPEELALYSGRLLGHYHNPLWFIEDNDWGAVTISTAQSLAYPKLGYRDKDKKKVGWHTDEKTRFTLWGKVIPAVNDRQIIIFNKDGLSQFYGIIRNIEKDGRIEAITGGHDDYPMALGIALSMKDKVQLVPWDSTPIESLHFRRG